MRNYIEHYTISSTSHQLLWSGNCKLHLTTSRSNFTTSPLQDKVFYSLRFETTISHSSQLSYKFTQFCILQETTNTNGYTQHYNRIAGETLLLFCCQINFCIGPNRKELNTMLFLQKHSFIVVLWVTGVQSQPLLYVNVMNVGWLCLGQLASKNKGSRRRVGFVIKGYVIAVHSR